MNENLFQGELVRLSVNDPEEMGKAFSRWSRDSEYLRLLDTEQAVVWSAKKFIEWFEEDIKKDQPNRIFLDIHTLDLDRVIGFVGLVDIRWNHGDAWVGIGIGDREMWGKGYGTDAMQIILRYAFTEVNLYRVTLGVFAYNQRAIRSYENAGFILEGREREVLYRDGSRADILIMGVLRKDWAKALKLRQHENDGMHRRIRE